MTSGIGRRRSCPGTASADVALGDNLDGTGGSCSGAGAGIVIEALIACRRAGICSIDNRSSGAPCCSRQACRQHHDCERSQPLPKRAGTRGSTALGGLQTVPKQAGRGRAMEGIA